MPEEMDAISREHETNIVSGDVILQMLVEADKINKIVDFIDDPTTITYKADMYREYNGSKVKIGTYTVTYNITDEMAENVTVTGTLSFAETDVAKYVMKYGLPIGTYYAGEKQRKHHRYTVFGIQRYRKYYNHR